MKINKKFIKEFTIDYNDINEDLSTSLTRIMGYVQETSLFHSLSSGYPMEYFTENNIGFLLTNWHVNILKYPKWGDKICITTWPSKLKGIMAERGFEVFDEDNRSIVQAVSRWVFTDLKAHKPIRIPDHMYTNYGAIYENIMETNFKLPGLSAYEKISESVFQSKRSDIDSNHHVNNIRYIGWAMDATPDKYYDSKRVCRLKVAYKKECTLNTQILLEVFQDTYEENNIMYQIKSFENQDMVFCTIYTKWQEFMNIK